MFVATVIACIIFAGDILYSVGRKYLGYNPNHKKAKAYLSGFRRRDRMYGHWHTQPSNVYGPAARALLDDEIEAMR